MDRFFVPYSAPRPTSVLLTVVRVFFLLLSILALLSDTLFIRAATVLALTAAASMLAAYELLIRDVSTRWVSGAVILIIAIGSTSYGVWILSRPPAPKGALLPADDPLPAMACSSRIRPHDLVIAVGANRLVERGKGPFHVLDIHDCPVLTLRRAGAGLMVNAFFYDWNDDIAFRIRDNVYETTMPLELVPYRPDPHTLMLLDQFGQEVLYVRFLNPLAVRIRGRFLCGDQPQVVVRQETVLTGGIRIEGAYLGLHRSSARICATSGAGQPGITLGGR